MIAMPRAAPEPSAVWAWPYTPTTIIRRRAVATAPPPRSTRPRFDGTTTSAACCERWATWRIARASRAQALALDPDHVPALVWAAEEALAGNHLDAARTFFARALSHDPENDRAIVGRARVAIAEGEPAAAVALLERALARQPSAVPIHYALGLAHRSLGHVERARDHFARVPANNLVHDALRVDDPLMRAVADLRVGARAHDLRGLKAATAGDHALAAIEFRQALIADPDHTYAGYGLGLALLNLGRRTEAVEALRTLLDTDPAHGPSLQLLARVRAQDGAIDEALSLLGTALAVDNNDEATHLALAEVLRDAGRFDQALEHDRRAQALDPSLEAARHGELLSLLATRRWPALFEALERHRATLPASRDLLALAIRLHAAVPIVAQRNGAAALVLAHSLTESGPVTASEAEAVAMAFAETGQYGPAVAWQRAVLGTGKGMAAPWAVERLARYRRREPCRRPWANGERLRSATVANPE